MHRIRTPRGMLRYVYQRVVNSPVVRPTTQEDRNVRLIYINTAMVGVTMGGVVAFLPVFLARLGASSTLLGWFNSLPSILLAILLIPGAAIAERHADQVAVRVKYVRLLRLGYLACAVLPFFVPMESLALILVLVWALTSTAEAVALPAWTTVMARALSPRRRVTVNSVRWALLAVVSALSNAVFGWLLDQIAFPLNYQVVFLLSYLISIPDPLAFSRIQVAPLVRQETLSAGGLLSRFGEYIKPALRSQPFVRYLLCTLPFRVALNLPVPLFSLFWVNELRAPDTLIGLRGTVANAALVIGYLLSGRLAHKVGHRTVLVLAGTGLAFYPIATSFVPSPDWLLPVAAIWGLTVGGIDLGLFDMLLAACPRDREPLFAAVANMEARLAMFAGPLIGATIAQRTSLRTALFLAGAIQLISILPLLLLPKDEGLLLDEKQVPSRPAVVEG